MVEDDKAIEPTKSPLVEDTLVYTPNDTRMPDEDTK